MGVMSRRSVRAIKRVRDVSAKPIAETFSWKRGDLVKIRARSYVEEYAPGAPVFFTKNSNPSVRLKDETVAIIVGVHTSSSAYYGRTKTQLWLAVMLMSYGGKHVFVRARDVELLSP